ISVPAGIWAGLREGRISDGIVRVTSQFGVSVPDFWMGLLLITLFSGILGWLPPSGYAPIGEDFTGWAKRVILPALTVGLVAAAILTRYVRAAVLEVAHTGFVRTARSKGLPERVVTRRHIVRNALVPVLTIVGIQLATIASGVFVGEVVFACPGLGRLVYQAGFARYYALIQGSAPVLV